MLALVPSIGPLIDADPAFSLPILPDLTLLLYLGPTGLTLGALLLTAILLLNAHLLHLLPACLAFGSLLLAAILLRPHGLTLLRTLSGLLPAGVHFVHPLLAARLVLLTHLLHHLLALLAAIRPGLLLRPLPFSSIASAPILTLRRAGLARLAAAATISSLLALNLSLRTAAVPTAATALSRRSSSVALSVSAASLALAERITLCADHDGDRRECGENQSI